MSVDKYFVDRNDKFSRYAMSSTMKLGNHIGATKA